MKFWKRQTSPSQESRTVVLAFGEEAGTEYRAARENSPGWWLCSMSWQACGLHTHTHLLKHVLMKHRWHTHCCVSFRCTSALTFPSILKWWPVVSLVTTCLHTKLFQHYSTFLMLHVTSWGFSFNNQGFAPPDPLHLFNPPPPSLLATTHLFSASISLFSFCLIFQILHITEIISVFSVRLISLSKMPSRSTHGVTHTHKKLNCAYHWI